MLKGTHRANLFKWIQALEKKKKFPQSQQRTLSLLCAIFTNNKFHTLNMSLCVMLTFAWSFYCCFLDGVRSPFMPAFGLKIYYIFFRSFSMFVPNSFRTKTRFLFSILCCVAVYYFSFFSYLFFFCRVTRVSPSLNQRQSSTRRSKNWMKRRGEKATNNNTDWNFCVMCHI